MKNIVTKVRFFASLEKELAFINEMNRAGYRLTDIRFGVIFRFKKAQGEHFTILCGTTKEKVPELTSAAVKGGYTCIAHTFDAMGNFLYLDGERGKVNEDFFSDNGDRRVHLAQMKKFYGASAVMLSVAPLTMVVSLVGIHSLMIPRLVEIGERYGCIPEQLQGLLWKYCMVTGAITLFALVFSGLFAVMIRQWRRSVKTYKNLDVEMSLYQ